MARHNLTYLLGFVTFVQIYSLPNGEPYAMAYITVGRAQRKTGDHKDHLKLDNPLIMSRNPEVVKEMSTWEQNDIVYIKGTIAAKGLKKASFCTFCETKNSADGVLVYINPIYARKLKHCASQDEAQQCVADNREISNQVFVFGTLCTDPKKITPKEGLVVTQYQVALNRKFRIQEDPPEQKSDYPWVKSYGENALQDRIHLHIGSQIFVDGCVQARKVNRHTVCATCQKRYDWVDRALEIVPYETEYIANFYTTEEREELEKNIREKSIQKALASLTGFQNDTIQDDVYTKEEIKAGIDSEEEN